MGHRDEIKPVAGQGERMRLHEQPTKRKPDVRRCDLWLTLVMRRTMLAQGAGCGNFSLAEETSPA